MVKINENFLKLQDNYLFSTISKKVQDYQRKNPDKEIIRLGIGDVTCPLPQACIKAMNKAILELSTKEGFKGYGPEQGYDFLREKIVSFDYAKYGVNLDKDEVFVSDGAKCDTGNIQELFDISNKIAITDPVYPVYLDSNVMAGRAGQYNSLTGKYENVVYMPVTSSNNFVPELLNEKIDLIYLCFPNNPTGTVLTKKQLSEWVNYARKNNSIILFDAAYEAFINEDNVPHSIYEIEGAKDVAIEFRSFSKTAGFTGIRCAYTIVPKELKVNGVSLNKLWHRRQCTKFNGVSYVTQRAAEAIYSEEGQKQIRKNINYYQENARIISDGLKAAGFEIYGGINSPYIWLKINGNMTSWEFFDELLEKVNIVGTPGSGFGPNGEGYFRLTAFGSREDTIKAIDRIKKWKEKRIV